MIKVVCSKICQSQSLLELLVSSLKNWFWTSSFLFWLSEGKEKLPFKNCAAEFSVSSLNPLLPLPLFIEAVKVVAWKTLLSGLSESEKRRRGRTWLGLVGLLLLLVLLLLLFGFCRGSTWNLYVLNPLYSRFCPLPLFETWHTPQLTESACH